MRPSIDVKSPTKRDTLAPAVYSVTKNLRGKLTVRAMLPPTRTELSL
jgi:hypothetical protein